MVLGKYLMVEYLNPKGLIYSRMAVCTWSP